MPETRGFDMPRCPLCGADDRIDVNLANVDVFHCDACGELFDAATVRLVVDGWLRILAWLDTAPVRSQNDAP